MKLIDADKLIVELKNLAKGQISSCPNIAEFFVSIRVDRIIDILNSQPTAFDVDKVVSELESEKKLYEYEYALQMDYYKGISAGYERALDIVKRGWNR